MINMKDIPIDDGTTVLSQQSMTLGHLDAVIQTWLLDGIKATSCIFSRDDVENLDDEQLKEVVNKAGLLEPGSLITFSRTGDFTFVNFNFDY